MFFNIYEINLFMNSISEVEMECNRGTMATKKTTHVLLPDQDSAYLLLFVSLFSFTSSHCFKRVGMRIPPFLFRVYILETEFDQFSQHSSIQYPIPGTIDFILRVCNDRNPAIRGMPRCIDVKDAFLSLQEKGHYLDTSTLLLMGNSGLNPIRSVDGQRRHLSVDASTSFLRSGSKDFSGNEYMSPHSRPFSRFDNSGFLSQTPLLGSSPFHDTLSTDERMPEFSLSHQPSLFSPSWNNQSLFSFDAPQAGGGSSIIDSINAERWNEPSLFSWTGDRSSSVGIRHSIDSNASHASILPPITAELFPSYELPESSSRSNSLGLTSSLQELNPLSHTFLTPTLTTLSSKSELSDNFSLVEPSALNRSERSSVHSAKTMTMNPNSAEFIPTFLQNAHPAKPAQPREEKWMSRREGLVRVHGVGDV